MAGVARTAEGPRGCPGFGPFWAASTVSSFGTYVTTLAVQVLVVLTLGGGAAEVGLISAARWLPYLLFGVFAGMFIDRARRRPILVTTDFVRCVLLVAIPTLAVAHHTGRLHGPRQPRPGQPHRVLQCERRARAPRRRSCGSFPDGPSA
jgi:hypothetical protein